MENLTYIIYVDDDNEDADQIKEVVFLINPILGFEYYKDGEDLIQSITTSNSIMKPALIILDLMMPKKGGLETLKDLKMNTTFSDVPIFIFSAFQNEKLKSTCLDFGAKEFIIKPYSYTEITKTMEYICAFL